MAPPSMPVNPGPFHFAWVESNDTTFDAERHAVEDELIYVAKRTHEEGKIPSLEIEIRNPGVGLLSAGRKRWAWFSWYDGAAHVPLFFGQLVGMPSDLRGETVTLQLISKPTDYRLQKRAVAEAMRVPPFYDDLCVDITKRDDPDAVLDGYTKLWHVDPVTMEVTTSDEIVGEDGTVTFTGDDAFYESVRVTFQTPKRAVRLDVDVGWTQAYIGAVDLPPRRFVTLTGNSFLSGWPKPGTQVGDGWTVMQGLVVDQGKMDQAQTVTYTYSFQNRMKTHAEGDVMSMNISWTKPNRGGGISEYTISETNTPGILDPFAVDENGDPAPENKPASASRSSVFVITYTLDTKLLLRYDARRDRTEHASFVLQSDVQDALFPSNLDDVDSSGDVIQLSAANVDKPTLRLRSWLSVRGQHVDADTFVFPEHPLLPISKTIQICTTPGTAGTDEPEFAEIQGDTTNDGSVVWTCLGVATTALTSAQPWAALTLKPIGALLLPENHFVESWLQLTLEGRLQLLPHGSNVSEGQLISTANGTFQQCTGAGLTGVREPNFSGTWGATTTDGTVVWTSLGRALPTGTHYFVCIQEGETGLVLPPFGSATTVGTTVADGTAVWRCMAVGEIPIGGTIGMVPSPVFFPTDRGRQLLEYCLCVAGAWLLRNSRVVKTTFDTTWDLAYPLTCRKNAVLQDARMPGGVAGKITKCVISVDGDSGQQFGQVEMYSCIGKGEAVEAVDGDPTYVVIDVLEPGIQVYDSRLELVSVVENVGYSVPVAGDVDDGLRFPLTAEQAVIHELQRGSYADQVAAVGEGIQAMKQEAADNTHPPDPEVADGFLVKTTQSNIRAYETIDTEMQKVLFTYELELAPVTNGPFEEWYSVETTKLAVPKQVDLESVG